MPQTTQPTSADLLRAPLAGLMAGPGQSPRPPTVLLVEDSRFAAEAVRLICRRAGLRLRRADSLATARRHLNVYRPDIALIDLGLPDGCGLDLIDELNRAKPRISRIVAITGDAVLEQAARRAGADEFLEKPLCVSSHLARMLGETVDLGEALETIDSALGLPVKPPAKTHLSGPCWPDKDASPRATETAPARNMGADPLALHDDLAYAHALLAQPPKPERIGYAAQFLTGIARSLDDQSLLALAERVRSSGEVAPLLAHLGQRVSTNPLL